MDAARSGAAWANDLPIFAFVIWCSGINPDTSPCLRLALLSTALSSSGESIYPCR
jgi:hypothetical protein